MHVLNAQAVPPDDPDTAVDLGQTAGDIVILSAADSELACLAAAQASRPGSAPSLRLANLLRLGHPLSVDLYVEQVIAHARLVVVRLLGGRSYWTYGVEQISATCRARGIAFAAVPGDDRPDPDLQDWSTVRPEVGARFWRYLAHGGLENARQLLTFAATLLGHDEPWQEPAPLLRAGLYGAPDLASLRARWVAGRPRAAIVFYRALVQAGDLAPIDGLIRELEHVGLDALPIYVTSLKDEVAAATAEDFLAEAAPEVVLNLTGFAVGSPEQSGTPLDRIGRPVLQVVLAGSEEAGWRTGSRGLSPRDLAMSVALPEIDGRVLARAIAFKAPPERDPLTEVGIVRYQPVSDRIRFVADLAAAWARLARTPPEDRKVGLVLANYPNRDGRIANGVGLDTPASAINVLHALADAGYRTEAPDDGASLVDQLLSGVTNALEGRSIRTIRVRLELRHYRRLFEDLQPAVRDQVLARWGQPEDDPHVVDGAFALAVLPLGNVVVGLQPARGYHIDPSETYHSPDLVPPHGYFAFYAWLRHVFGAHAILHLGKHGNLEWLPGKALALSDACFPEAVFGPLPHLYPFIVNDPGEGSQAKRRAQAVIVDHLTPPLTRAEAYGPLLELEQRVDEYAEAAALDPRRARLLRDDIVERTQALGLDRDLALDLNQDTDAALATLDNHLCELKELQIRDGLHVLGKAPADAQLSDLLVALVRVPRGSGEGPDASILRALTADLGLGHFEPLSMELFAPWDGPRPAQLASLLEAPWRTAGDTVERLEALARALIAGEQHPDPTWTRTRLVLRTVSERLRPALQESAAGEIQAVLDGLDGRFVPPGPSGAPTRGRLDVLPTGRNFFSIDTRAVPTPAAWRLGWQSATLLIERYLQEQGEWPRTIALSAWGTANMRTGGDDLAQALALLGVQPVWDASSHRVTGIEVIPLQVLDRPRVDVTLRVSGFFRDAFPAQIALIDQAVRAIAALDEPDESNPLAAHARAETAELEAKGLTAREAERRATYRVFGSKPGAYGAGLQALIDEHGWENDADLARAYVAWGGYAYGSSGEGEAGHELFERRLEGVELVLHNQDNREHDLLDSDDYYQFEGGLTAAVRELSGEQPQIFHNDHSRPEMPRIRTLKEELGRIVRGRAANPKWIRGVMRHGYKGAFEMAATVDYLFAFAATSRVVENHHFDAVYDAYLGDAEVRAFMAEANPAALRETAERFEEAIARGLWHPRRNDVGGMLSSLAGKPQQ